MADSPSPRIFLDATPLIALARINRLDLLTLLPEPRAVTSAVWSEVTGHHKPGEQELLAARQDSIFSIVALGDPTAYPLLGAGEASTLSAAASVGAAVMVDEQKARNLLAASPALAAIPGHISTVGLILLAKRRGRITQARPLLDQLRAQTFRMSADLYRQALESAGEWPPATDPDT